MTQISRDGMRKVPRQRGMLLYIYVIYRAGGPYGKKTVPEVLSTARGRIYGISQRDMPLPSSSENKERAGKLEEGP